MNIAKQVYKHMQSLPANMQQEALHYVEFLKAKLTKPTENELSVEKNTSSITPSMKKAVGILKGSDIDGVEFQNSIRKW